MCLSKRRRGGFAAADGIVSVIIVALTDLFTASH